MINNLPKWVEYGAFVLAFVAGCVNAVGLLGFDHQSVSHVSGTASLFGVSLFTQVGMSKFYLLGVLLSFLFGAFVSGWLLHGTTLKLGRHYETILVLEALCLFIALYLLLHEHHIGIYMASFACGMQNALVTTYSGAVVRTTHLTGIFTDFGIMLGEAFQGKKIDKRKLILFLLIIFGFVSGGTIGGVFFQLWGFKTLYLPAITCLILALCYRAYSYYELENTQHS